MPPPIVSGQDPRSAAPVITRGEYSKHSGILAADGQDLPIGKGFRGLFRASPVSLHVVGRLTDSVFRFVGPATEALGKNGPRQIVLAITDPDNPHLPRQFAPHVKVVALPWDRNPLRRWVRWLAVFRRIRDQGPLETVHMHGFIPSVILAPVLRRRQRANVVYTPHGSRTEHGESPIHRLARFVFQPWLRDFPQYVSLASEARSLAENKGSDAEVLETPVDDAYLEVPLTRAHHPLLLGGVHDDPAETAARFSQLAVLLGNGDEGVAFNWVGPADAESRHRLAAAEVAVFDDRNPRSRAERLAAGWVFLCPTQTHGFPGHLAEAMACGLPIVAMECPRHRDLIDNGRTGYLCATDEDMLHRVNELIAHPERRAAMGEAARLEAQARFASERFQDALLRNYPRSPGRHGL